MDNEISENRWTLAGMLIDIYDDETFVNTIDSACDTEEEIIDVINYIEKNNPNHEDVYRYIVTMRLNNKKHPIFDKKR